MRRTLIRRVGPRMALLALGLLGIAVVELGSRYLGSTHDNIRYRPLANLRATLDNFPVDV